MFLSLLLNVLGIYCLQTEREGIRKQRLLLSSLSLIEIIKVLYDYVQLTIYYYRDNLFNLYNAYFDTVEISVMTIIYASHLLISFDRLLCVLFQIKYNFFITEKLIKVSLVMAWLIGLSSGPLMYGIASSDEYAKLRYYMVCDIIVLAIATVTYLSYGKLIMERKHRFQHSCEDDGRMNNLKKMFLIPSLIIASFIIFNVIPDLIMFYHFNDVVQQVTSCLWALGLNTDPFTYIYLNNASWEIAISLLKRLKHLCCACCYKTVSTEVRISIYGNVAYSVNTC